jgi:hypothetical protein
MEGYMPNWCSNSITITGPVEKIAALWTEASTAGEHNTLLNAMRPMPKELLEGEAWYGWRVENWGTKWDIDMQGLEFEEFSDGTAAITGWANSAWSPPVDAFQAYSNENPDVMMELKYFEPGMGFVGVWDNEGGDAYWEGVSELLETTEEEDAVLYGLLEHFDASGWYDTDEEEVAEENFEIDVDGNFRVNE